MGAILLRNITVDGSQKDVLIEKNLIRKIEGAGAGAGWDIAGDIEIMDCTGKVAIPGFINMHTHAAMSMMRGVGEDVLFHQWLDRIWKIESRFDANYVYWGTKVACLEMIRTGTTTFNDHYWFASTGHKAAVEMGLRPMTAYILCDSMGPKEETRQREECTKLYEESREWTGPSAFVVGCHSVYSVSEGLLEWARDFAREHGLKIHIHISETEKEVVDCKAAHSGLSPVEYLDSLGMLDGNLIAAHTLWLSDHDIELLGKNHVNCVHNVNSNLKLASGYKFKYNELRDAGANICIGTDGCASSNNMDMLEAMKTSAILQKAWRNDPAAMPLDELLKCATSNGARALGINAGVIEEGRIADICIIDTDNSFFLSPAPFLANLVYSAHNDCIDSVICNGEFVMRHKEIKDEKEILREAGKAINQIQQ